MDIFNNLLKFMPLGLPIIIAVTKMIKSEDEKYIETYHIWFIKRVFLEVLITICFVVQILMIPKIAFIKSELFMSNYLLCSIACILLLLWFIFIYDKKMLNKYNFIKKIKKYKKIIYIKILLFLMYTVLIIVW